MSLSAQILAGLAAGIGCGLFLGDYCASLSFVGTAFVGLLQMTVLPYLVVSLVSNLGKLSSGQSRRLSLVGGAVLAVLWGTTLFTVFALAHTFPAWKAGSFFSTAITEPPATFDILSVFIPANLFEALAKNHVPAVVLLSIFLGLALASISRRDLLIPQLDVLAAALVKVNGMVVRLAPLGVFAMAASAAGTISPDELVRLQAYLIAYTCGALLLGFVVLPLLVTCCTDLTYREVLSVSKDAMMTAFATGKLVVVLPLLIEQTEQLFARRAATAAASKSGTAIEQNAAGVPAIDVLYPVAYAFPHVGKLLTILFVPFAAWFLGNALAWSEYPLLLSAGLFSSFGGPTLSVPFLLDLTHLPHDMFQLFLLSGVYGGRIGDALGVMHLVTFTLLATCAFLGQLRIEPRQLAQWAIASTLCGIALLAGLRLGLSQTLRFVEGKEEIIAHMQLLEEPVPHTVSRETTPNPDPLAPGESLLERIHRRGKIRVGYNEDKLPFAYFNTHGELVGFDINMAHALARDLGVEIEFVRFDRLQLAEQLNDDCFDVVMSGLTGTLERSQAMQHTSPYLDLNLGLVLPDYRVREARSLENLRAMSDAKIGFIDLSRGFTRRLRSALPRAEFVELDSYQQYFDGQWRELTALLISAESGSAFTLLYPEFEVVIPTGVSVSLPLFYAVGKRDAAMNDFLEHWVELRKKDGTTREYYDHWVLGKSANGRPRRWSIIRDVLHWVP